MEGVTIQYEIFFDGHVNFQVLFRRDSKKFRTIRIDNIGGILESLQERNFIRYDDIELHSESKYCQVISIYYFRDYEVLVG